MSGGVDSSVAAQLLMHEGHDVIGVFMRHGVEPSSCADGDETLLPIITSDATRTDHKQGCCTARDADDARRVASQLSIPFYALNLSKDFGRIIDYFVDQYTIGRTPNPCIMCNNWIKFGRLFDYADSVSAEFVATGHYARLGNAADESAPALWRGRDASKDQSYVLFGIQRRYLDRMLLPVGDFHKHEIRSLAAKLGMRVAEKRDSQEICFVTSGQHASFVASRQSEATAGEIVTTTGEIVGRHQGIEGFTIGQRKGLGVAMGEPYFVVEIDPLDRRIVIGRHADLACRGLVAGRTNWLVPAPKLPKECLVQIRYNSPPVAAKVQYYPQDDCLNVDFDTSCYGVAPGQAVVCYDGERVMGGGWIESTTRSSNTG
jgi:tRNA-specific 2-thiouridylase